MQSSVRSRSAREACRSLTQPMRHAALSNPAFPSSNICRTSSSSSWSYSPSSVSGSLSSAPSTWSSTSCKRKGKPTHASLSPLSLSYSTSTSDSTPSYPFPQSNNTIDAKGVDYNLFEQKDPSYTQFDPANPTRQPLDSPKQSTSPSAPRSSASRRPLSPSAETLLRLIKDRDFATATTVLHELHLLGGQLDDALPEYSHAALWAIRNGRENDMLLWINLCPTLAPHGRFLSTSSPLNITKQIKMITANLRKIFVFLLDSHGDAFTLLQTTGLAAARKGYWSVIQTTLAQILRFGVTKAGTSDQHAYATQGWKFFSLLMKAAQTDKKLAEDEHRVISARIQLRFLYNLGIRTLALAGRLDDAIQWVKQSLQKSQQGVLRVEIFTQNLLIEELVKAGPDYIDKAKMLEEDLIEKSSLSPRNVVNVDQVIARMRKEMTFKEEVMDTEQGKSPLDAALLSYLSRGDIYEAREHLLSVLRTAHRKYVSSANSKFVDTDLSQEQESKDTPARSRSDDIAHEITSAGESMKFDTASGPGNSRSQYVRSTQDPYSHLPSAAVLAELQEQARKMGTIPVIASPSKFGTKMDGGDQDLDQVQDRSQERDQDRTSSSYTQETMTDEEFLRPVLRRLTSVRAGKGLWETARLYSLIKKGKWWEAIKFYTSPTGFKMPAGGITSELIQLALGQEHGSDRWNQNLAAQADQSQNAKDAKRLPSTHAINLLLRAIVGSCIESQDYGRLEKVYQTWKTNSLPRPASRSAQDMQAATNLGGDLRMDLGREDEVLFESWPPSQRPDSYTFDAFIRAFARLEVPVAGSRADGLSEGSTSASAEEETTTERKPWGSSQAVLEVIRDMTEVFHVKPTISTWTIALECLAREGRDRWASTTETLAKAVGIDTAEHFSESSDSASPSFTPSSVSSREDSAHPSSGLDTLSSRPDFPDATVATYTALMRALIRVSSSSGGSMISEAGRIRDDLLSRIIDLDQTVENMGLNNAQPQAQDLDDEALFWQDLLDRWHLAQRRKRTSSRVDRRPFWPADWLIKPSMSRTKEALKEVWHMERLRKEEEEALAKAKEEEEAAVADSQTQTKQP